MERVKGIEPSSQAWEARILPLNHTHFPSSFLCSKPFSATQCRNQRGHKMETRVNSPLF